MNKFTLIDRAFFLKKTALFCILDLDLLLPIADKLQVINFDKGDPIFRPGEEAYRLYFIVKGKVEIRVEQQPTTLLEAEDFFGDESIFNEQPRAYSAISHTEVTLLALSRTNLLTIISECPSVAIGLLQAYTLTTPFRLRKEMERNKAK
jgi:CRP/FNR family cyclic AMP-dependent transcriptional regulator